MEAKQYLEQQKVESALANAVAKAIQERPANAIAHIAEALAAAAIPIPPPSELKKSTWVVTGTAQGTGLEIVKILSKGGHQVFATCRKASSALKALPGVTVIEGISLESEQVGQNLASKLNGVTVDVLVNNAAIFDKSGSIMHTFMSQTADTISSQQLRDGFEINLLGTMRIIQALTPLLKSPGGKIANISTTAASLRMNAPDVMIPPPGGWYSYRISKAGLNMYTRGLAVDLKDKGIAVSMIHPGIGKTELNVGTEGYEKQALADSDPFKAFESFLQHPEALAKGVLLAVNATTMDNTGSFLEGNYGEKVTPIPF